MTQLHNVSDWDGLWILNPDTRPYPNALAALVQRAATSNKGMISSTIVTDRHHELVHCRGLRWDRFLARVVSIGFHELAQGRCDVDAIEAAMDSPSGASMYVTRECAECVGPMDERFFLYFEDLDWGIRAKRFGLGYARDSIVLHNGGTTIGSSSGHRAGRSRLSVYLQYRNLLLFVRKHYPVFSPLANTMAFIYASMFLAAGSLANFTAALQGIVAAWSGEIGAPGKGHLRRIFRNTPTVLSRKVKFAISLAYYYADSIWRTTARTVGRSPLPRLVILYYHGVRGDYRFEFGRQMNMLSRIAHVVPADFQGALATKQVNVAITFDDAFVSVAENAFPELVRRSFHTTIFVPAGLIGRAPNWAVDDPSMTFEEVVMTAEQLKALSPTVVTIGSHGLHHSFLSKIDTAEAKYELERSREVLEEITGRKVDLLAFPYGDYNGYLVELCKAAGYRHVYLADATAFKSTDFNFVRGRIKVEPSDGEFEFFLKINGAYNWTSVIRAGLNNLHKTIVGVSAKAIGRRIIT